MKYRPDLGELPDNEPEHSMPKFIRLSTDPSSYGQEFPVEELPFLNARIRSAALDAGLSVLEGDPESTMRDAATREDAGATEIDWFTKWCNVGWKWNTPQWVRWFKSQ